jgi:pyridoxal biosynthesis lyase PdxS
MQRTFLAAIALISFGCASHPAPTDQVASSLAAVRGAEEAGALEVPEAALHVKLAQEQIDQAKKLMSEDENLRAEDLAIRAFQDAELALAIARENASKKKLDQFAQASGAATAGGEHPGMPTAPAGAPATSPTTIPGQTGTP